LTIDRLPSIDMKKPINLLLIILCTGGAGQACAQAYPARPVTVVVPAPAGGPTDIVGRLVAQMLTDAFSQTVIADNRTGAGLTIGTTYAAKAKPDGYTLTIASPSSHSIAPGLYPHLPYDPIKDFDPITLLVTSPTVLVVHPSLPAKTLKEFIALARSKPGQLNYGSGGNGTTSHLTAELFKTMARVSIQHIPYKGSAPATTDLLGGQIQMMFHGLHLTLPYITSSKLRALGVTSPRRSAMAPDLPTLHESGLPGFRVNAWYGVMTPAGTPKAIIELLNAALIRSLNAPGTKQRLANQGMVAVGSTPEELAAVIREELQVWSKVIRESGAKID
jgi:tripartite-type tricarboxylate transporter receptor subunit TctC